VLENTAKSVWDSRVETGAGETNIL
jgi:hypothetical protein